MNPETLFAVQQAAWCGLMALGMLHILVAAGLREDRVFSWLGISILLLCAITAMDIWIVLPGMRTPLFSDAVLEAALIFNQIFACAYVAVGLRFTRALTGWPGKRALRIQDLALAAFTLAFLVDLLHPSAIFLAFRRGQGITTWMYDWVFAPYLIAQWATVFAFNIRGFRRARGEVRRTLGLICFAYGALLLFGVLDFLTMMGYGGFSDTSFTGIGMLAMGLIGAFMFTDRLVLLYEGRHRSLLKIAEISGTVEAQRPLGELGRSAAGISEQIRGYVAGLKTDAHALREDPLTGHRADAARIDGARRKLEAYTTGILEYSKSARLGAASPVDPAVLAERCLREKCAGFPGAAMRVTGRTGIVWADAEKLERALAELVRNSLEAGARTVEIRLREACGRVSLAVDDDGRGIDPSQIENISKPFFTTRKGAGASGLGASIAEGIAVAHGGSLRFYRKGGIGLPGMLANLVLPGVPPSAAEAHGAGTGGMAAVLISDGGPGIGAFLAVCANIGVRPVVLRSGDARRGWRKEFEGLKCVFLDTEAHPALEWLPEAPCYRLGPGGAMTRVSIAQGGIYAEPDKAGIFCEESCLAVLGGNT